MCCSGVKAKVVNHKRVRRLYREEGLNIRYLRTRRKLVSCGRQDIPKLSKINERWAMDFVSDALYDGRRIRALTIVDAFSRESLGILVDKNIRGEKMVDALEQVKKVRGVPVSIQCDNGTEFTSKALDKWAYENKVEIKYSRPCRPTDNAQIESFNGRFREECLSSHWFLSLDDARENPLVLPEGL